ncbi:hypothetical protein SADUNF_Sadunf07G0099600 [Salix dunnii]|uniref:Uncharacterized protein n=1 Tax=Salix dunnii TaxID=1413687 RepID=A0A835K5Z0_9ROSI|nr:hypothetical protein SADUNF_Sadunf07G0099600 [Salix dunnii]
MDAEITQEGGRGVLDENPVNLLQGEEGAIAGTSPDQKVQRRENSKSGKRVKKRKSKGMVLRAIGEENEQFESENDSMLQKLQLMQDDMEMQKTEFCASQNIIIAAQEICVETLYQKLQLMCIHARFDSVIVGLSLVHVWWVVFHEILKHIREGGSDHLDAAPSKGNQSLDDITELKHRSMLNTKNIDVLSKMLLK